MSEVTANRLLGLLADIETALPALAAAPAVREVGSQVLSGGGFGSQPPGNVDVLDLLWWASNRAVEPKLWSWAEMIYDYRVDLGLDDDYLLVGWNLAAVCGYLRSKIGWTVTQPWIDEMLTEWTEIRGSLRRAPGSPLFVEVLERAECSAWINDVAGGRRCLGIIETRLRIRGDRVHVATRCNECGRIYDDAEMVAVKAAAVDEDIVTGDQVLAQLGGEGLHITATQLWHWASRGSVTRHGKSGRDQTYSLTEVRAYARHQRDRVTLAGVGVPSRPNGR